MEAVIRATIVYFFLLILFRISGKTTLSEISTFDFILLLIISEAVQEPLIDGDQSMMNGITVIITLIFLSIVLSNIKRMSKGVEKVLEGTPVILVAHGKPFKNRMDKERVDEADILESARKLQGLERMEQIKYAILEKSGGISIIPKK